MAKSSSNSVIHLDNISMFLSELFGTALLVFFGCSSCLKWTADGGLDLTQIVLSFGLAVLVSVQIFGCVSGCHINPAVTLAAVIYNMISVKMAAVYVIAQCIGAFMGYGLLLVATPASVLKLTGESFCVTKPAAEVSLAQGFLVEFIATAALIWFCCGIWDPRNGKHHDSVPLRFGLAVSGLALASAKFTGGSLNPARSLGPVLLTGDYEAHWMYWLAPLSGSAVAALIYKYVFRREVIEAEEYGQNMEIIGEGSSKA